MTGIAQDQLERWISQLASIERPSASEGERRAAEWIAAQLQRIGVDARLEVERAHGTHLPFALPSLIALIAGSMRSRRVSALAASLATVVMVDELEGWRRILRRGLAFRRTYNVVAELGAPGPRARSSSSRTTTSRGRGTGCSGLWSRHPLRAFSRAGRYRWLRP